MIHEHPISTGPALAEEANESAHWRYRLTDDELSALEWIGGRYEVVSVLLSSLEDGVIDLGWCGCQQEVAQALKDEGIDRVPCLSESTSLAYLVWIVGGVA
jgi:hypothetical protein